MHPVHMQQGMVGVVRGMVGVVRVAVVMEGKYRLQAHYYNQSKPSSIALPYPKVYEETPKAYEETLLSLKYPTHLPLSSPMTQILISRTLTCAVLHTL
jgi:hypothetical protein